MDKKIIKNKKISRANDDLVNEILKEFKVRQNNKKELETQWRLNINFVNGKQFTKIDRLNEVGEQEKQFYWQENEVYNHLTPIYESRLSKLARVRPRYSVIPASTDEKDIQSAKVSKQILQAVNYKFNLSDLIRRATRWSEICGSVFYKVLWDKDSGRVVAQDEQGQTFHEGDINVSVISPFEIYPDTNHVENIEDCRSIIHARAYNVETIYDMWGVKLEGKDLDVVSLGEADTSPVNYLLSNNKFVNKTQKNQEMVIEYYEVPSNNYPNGRLIIIAGNQLVYNGVLPFLNMQDKKRGFPFIKQVSNEQVNSFWGVSIVERLIPLQRALNAVKNRKHEFLNRLSMGVITVEDGSIDIDNLEEEGLNPGKVIVYRQGANPPTMLNTDSVPYDFFREEDMLASEMMVISGASDLMRNLSTYSNMSGVALQLLVEQDDARLTGSAEAIREAVKKLGKHVLRLYKQFVETKRFCRLVGNGADVEVFYFNGSDISSEDVIFETENELTETVAQKRTMIFDLLKTGLLYDENGKMNNRMRAKVLDMLGLGIWENHHDLTELQRKNAQRENLSIRNNGEISVEEFDEHDVHIDEHMAYLLSEENKLNDSKNSAVKNKLVEHIKEHRAYLAIIKENEIREVVGEK